MIKVHFCSSWKPGAVGIQVFTKSIFSHVAIEVDNKLYEARFHSGVHTPKTIEDVVYTVGLRGLDEEAMKVFLDTQVGKAYDSTAIIAFVCSRDWEDTNEWFCSELVAMALKVGNFPNIPKDVNLIDPGSLFKIINNNTHTIGEIIYEEEMV